jgi:hypothetical protein
MKEPVVGPEEGGGKGAKVREIRRTEATIPLRKADLDKAQEVEVTFIGKLLLTERKSLFRVGRDWTAGGRLRDRAGRGVHEKNLFFGVGGGRNTKGQLARHKTMKRSVSSK